MSSQVLHQPKTNTRTWPVPAPLRPEQSFVQTPSPGSVTGEGRLEVIMFPWCSVLPRTIGNLKKLHFCNFLLYFIHYWLRAHGLKQHIGYTVDVTYTPTTPDTLLHTRLAESERERERENFLIKLHLKIIRSELQALHNTTARHVTCCWDTLASTQLVELWYSWVETPRDNELLLFFTWPY